MPAFEITVDVARPPAEVLAYLTDVSKLPEWQSSATAAEIDSAVARGARIRERRQFLGRDVRTELEVTTYEPPVRFDLASRGGPVAFSIAHELAPTEGGTRLHVRVDVKLGTMMRLAGQGPLRIAEREFRQDFERLKRVLEAA